MCIMFINSLVYQFTLFIYLFNTSIVFSKKECQQFELGLLSKPTHELPAGLREGEGLLAFANNYQATEESRVELISLPMLKL
jgi:hypothetical protein